MAQFYTTILNFVLIYLQVVLSCNSRSWEPSSSAGSHSFDSGCRFNLDADSPKNPPHLINKVTKEIIQPMLHGSSRILTLTKGQQIAIVCEGSNNILTATGQQRNYAICGSHNTFEIEHAKLRLWLNETGCKKAVKETIRVKSTCHHSARLIQIGWQIDQDFIEQLTLCYDKLAANTLYSTGRIIGASIQADDESNKRPSFRKGQFYSGIDVEKAYTQSEQMLTMIQLFGAVLAAKYINVAKSYYFARGHLAPDGDFIDAASQDATYYYINVAPQWQSVNNGNWRALESAVRNLAASRVLTLTTYTGGFDVLKLPNSHGKDIPIYLTIDDKNNSLIPVPKYYWKVVHDPLSKTATAFVAFNNPHMNVVKAEDIFCEDVCDQLPWVTWKRRKIPSGYMFCCTVQALSDAIPYAPKLGAFPLLV